MPFLQNVRRTFPAQDHSIHMSTMLRALMYHLCLDWSIQIPHTNMSNITMNCDAGAIV